MPLMVLREIPEAQQSPLSMNQSLGYRLRRDDATENVRARTLCDFQLEACEVSAFPQASWRRLMTRRMQSSKFNLTQGIGCAGFVFFNRMRK